MNSITRTQKTSGLFAAAIATAFAVILTMGFGMTAQEAQADHATSSNATTVYVHADSASTSTPNGTTDAPFLTIMDGVNHATSGDSVLVLDSATPYTENITINKEIALEAENQHQATIDGSVVIETNNASSSHVRLEGFVIDGTTVGGKGVSITAANSSSFNGSAVISGNDIKHFVRGIILDYNDPQNNETVLIQWNYIHDNEIGVNAQGSIGDASVEIMNNNIKYNDNGIDSAGTGVVVNQNNIVDNDNGLTNYSDSVFNTQLNWWGDGDGPSSTSTDTNSVTTDAGFPDGSVDYTPWLCDEFEGNPKNSDEGCDDDATPPSSGGGGGGGAALAPASGSGDVAGDRDDASDNDDDDDSNGEVLGDHDENDDMTDAEMSAALSQMATQLRNLLAILQDRMIGFPNTGDGSIGNAIFAR